VPRTFEVCSPLLYGPVMPARDFVLRLYVLGSTPASTAAIANVKRVCEEELAGRHRLEVIDVYEHPERAAEDRVLAVPTLVRASPRPVRRLIGDLSDHERLVSALDTGAGIAA